MQVNALTTFQSHNAINVKEFIIILRSMGREEQDFLTDKTVTTQILLVLSSYNTQKNLFLFIIVDTYLQRSRRHHDTHHAIITVVDD